MEETVGVLTWNKIQDGNKWIYKNKERGQMCATASLGLIHLWDPDVGCNVLDAFSYTDNENVKVRF